MKHRVALTVTSLLSILFSTFHLCHDIPWTMSPGGFFNLPIVIILVVWLYATLALGERRLPSVIVLVASLLASALPMLHMSGRGVARGATAWSGEIFFFAWTLIALGVTSIFSVLVAARGLWSLRLGQPG